jgi:hypothetical protein
MRLLALPLGMIKAAESDCAFEDQAGVGGENHVGGARLRFDQENVGNVGYGGVEGCPLIGGALAGRAVHISGHPGVDDVVHVIERGGTHEKGGLVG